LLQTIIDFGVKNSNKEWIGKVNRIIHNTDSSEIVCFGASSGEVGFNSPVISKTLGKTVYNYSIDGTSFFQYKCLIQNFIEKNRTCRLIVMIESPFTFSKPNQITAAERYMQYINNDYIYSSLVEIQPDIIEKCRSVPFYKYVTLSHTYYKNSFLGYKRLLNGSKERDTLFGFTPVYRKWEEDYDDFLIRNTNIPMEINAEVINEYNRILGKMTNLRIPIVIIIPPIHIELKKRLSGFGQFQMELRKVSKLKGIKLFDFSTSFICYNKSNFYNGGHLNFTGSQVFSKILSDSILASHLVY